MKKTIIAGAALIAALSFAPSGAFAAVALPAPVPPPPFVAGTGGGGATVPWIIGGCVTGIVIAAFHANWRDNRELTAPEAWTCGLLYWFSTPTPKQKARRARRR